MFHTTPPPNPTPDPLDQVPPDDRTCPGCDCDPCICDDEGDDLNDYCDDCGCHIDDCDCDPDDDDDEFDHYDQADSGNRP